MCKKIEVFSRYLGEEELEYLDGILVSLLPPYDERAKIIMIEEYEDGKPVKIIGSMILDGEFLQDISNQEEGELEQNLIDEVLECLKIHSYETEKVIQIFWNSQIQYWIEECFDEELKGWKKLLKIQKDSRLY